MFRRPLVALDIGSSAVKVVELTGRAPRRLRAIGLDVVPPGVIVDGVIQRADVLKGVVSELLKRLRIHPRGRRAALALSGSSVLIKRIEIAAKGAELAEQVYYEAEQQLKTDMNEIYFDYSVLSESHQPTEGVAPGGDGGQPVVIVGAKREMIEGYIALMRDLGLRTGVVECAALSVANMFEHNYGPSSGLTALINVGASATQVSLVDGTDYLFTRDVPIGGEEYSRRVMEALGVERNHAEALKVGASIGDGSAPADVARMLAEVNDQLTAEVQLTRDFYAQGAGAGRSLAQAYLTGGGSKVLGLDATLAAGLQVPVQIANPFQRIGVDPKRFQMDYILQQGHLFGVAVGLGLRAVGD